MIRLALSLLLLCALSGPLSAQTRSADLASNLASISSRDSSERQAAERWLAAHLLPGDLESLVAALRQADLEVQRRLARSIGQADRDLRLATGLLGEPDPALQEAGRRALELNINAWNSSAWRPGLQGPLLNLRLKLASSESWPEILRVPVLPSLGETCALLERRADLPVGLCVAPAVTGRLPTAGVGEIQGTWDEVVLRLGEVYRVSLDGHGLEAEGQDGVRTRFLRFCSSTRLAEPGVDVLIAWCSVLVGEVPLAERVAAARALASSGWGAALDWLSIRVQESRDPAALEGLLSAAAKGRIAHALTDRELLRSLLQTAEADLRAGDSEGRARRILAAFRHMRAIGPGGRPLGPEILEGWEQAELTGRWLRLAILTRLRSPEARAQAASILEDAQQDPLLYRQAMRAWIAASVGLGVRELPRLARPAALLGAFEDLDAAARAAQEWALAGFEPPASWQDPARLPAGLDRLDRVALLSWFVALGQVPASAAHWRALLSHNQLLWRHDSLELSRAIDAIGIEHAGLLRAAWRQARQQLPEALPKLSLDRSAFLAGILEARERNAVWNRLVASFAEQGLDWMAMAVLSGRGWNSEVGQKVCQQLVDEFAGALRENRSVEDSLPLIEALVRSVGEMEQAGWEHSSLELEPGRRNLSEQWSEQLRRLAGQHRRSPLGTYFSLHWPPPLESGMRDLEAEERIPLVPLRVREDSPTEGAAFRR